MVDEELGTDAKKIVLLQSHIGDLEPQQVHDQTLEPFVRAPLAAGASATTINRSLEVVRTTSRCPRTHPRPTELRRKTWFSLMTSTEAVWTSACAQERMTTWRTIGRGRYSTYCIAA